MARWNRDSLLVSFARAVLDIVCHDQEHARNGREGSRRPDHVSTYRNEQQLEGWFAAIPEVSGLASTAQHEPHQATLSCPHCVGVVVLKEKPRAAPNDAKTIAANSMLLGCRSPI